MIEYIMLGYLILTSIIIGVLMHLKSTSFENFMLSILWPFLIAILPFVGIAALTMKILDVIDKKEGTK